MEYYLICNTSKPKKGIPVKLNALLHEHFAKDGASKGMNYKWTGRADTLPERGAPFSFPKQLWLISKDKAYDFDCHLAYGGMLVSEKFMKLLEPGDLSNFKTAEVHAVDKNSTSISKGKMYYAKFHPIIHAVNRSKTKYIQAKFGPDLATDRSGLPAIGLVKTLCFDETNITGMNIFVSHDLTSNDTFISKSLYDVFRDNNIEGLEFTPIKDYLSAEQDKIPGIEMNYGRPWKEIAMAD